MPGGFVLLQNETTLPIALMPRPADWQTPTKMIRLPEAHEDQLKVAAHHLEAGDKLIPISTLDATTRELLQAMRPQDRRAAARAYRRLMARLIEPQLRLHDPQQRADIERHQ